MEGDFPLSHSRLGSYTPKHQQQMRNSYTRIWRGKKHGHASLATTTGGTPNKKELRVPASATPLQRYPQLALKPGRPDNMVVQHNMRI